MSSVRKASLIVAASIVAVEGLKDQVGLCRWNHAIGSLDQRAKDSSGSFLQAMRIPSSSNIEAWKERERDGEKAKWSEESLRKVMLLSCWGPN